MVKPTEPNVQPRSPIAVVLWACDIVFGSITMGLAVLATVLCLLGKVDGLTAGLLWSIPSFNLFWTWATRTHAGLGTEVGRHVVSMPIAVTIYVVSSGPLERMWIPALVLAIGFVLQDGVTRPWRALSYVVTLAYAGALLVASWISASAFDFAALDDALGVVVGGFVLAVVTSSLGQSIKDAGHQRDRARAEQHRAEDALQKLTERSSELQTAVASLRDEMDRRLRAEVELNQVHKLEAVGRLAAGVAHEINTPVQFISDSIEFAREAMPDVVKVLDALALVQRSVLDGTPSTEAAIAAGELMEDVELPYVTERLPLALERARGGLDRVTAIVRSLKEFAHPDSTEQADADVNRAIQSTLTIATNEWKYVADVETDLGDLPRVRCHLGELNQVVLNIIVNAAHAIGDVDRGGSKGKIRVSTRCAGDDIVIAISDTGGGIPEAVRSRVFDPFFTTKAVGRGTGQGLAIAHSVIEKHHGQITFETEIGKGTTFTIRLPIDHMKPKQVAAHRFPSQAIRRIDLAELAL